MRQVVKYLLILLTLLPLFDERSFADDVRARIDLAIDYAKSGLSDEAKKILVPLLHDGDDNTAAAAIRFTLGAICLTSEQNLPCVSYHWQKVLMEHPESEEAHAVRDIQAVYAFVADANLETYTDSLTFDSELRTANKLWTYEPPDLKMDWDRIQDPEFALSYLDVLSKKYEGNESKRAYILWSRFMLLAGYNAERYGLQHALAEQPQGRKLKLRKEFLDQCDEISSLFKSIPWAKSLYVRTQFLLGLQEARTGLSSRVKLTDSSIEYFENVMVATEGDIANPYRLFAFVWLRDYRESEARLNSKQKKRQENSTSR